MSEFISRYSNPGGVVLDLFAGTGSVGEAAIATGRRAILGDKDGEIVRLVAKRLAACEMGEKDGKVIKESLSSANDSLLTQLDDDIEVASIVCELPEEEDEGFSALTQLQQLQKAMVCFFM